MCVTFRAPSCTKCASHARGSLLTLGRRKTIMARDTRFDLGYAAFQAAFAVALAASPEIKYIEAIMICLAVSLPSSFAMWSYRVPTKTTELFLVRLARLLAYGGGFFAFSFFLGSFSYAAGLTFMVCWLFWLISHKFPEGSDIP